MERRREEYEEDGEGEGGMERRREEYEGEGEGERGMERRREEYEGEGEGEKNVRKWGEGEREEWLGGGREGLEGQEKLWSYCRVGYMVERRRTH